MLLQMTQGGIGIKDLSVIEESERERERQTERQRQLTSPQVWHLKHSSLNRTSLRYDLGAHIFDSSWKRYFPFGGEGRGGTAAVPFFGCFVFVVCVD
jgi:hypothetical protein